MSLPQSRPDKSDTQYRKLGRSDSSGNQQRGFSEKGGGSRGGSVPPAPALSSKRSFKKSNNAQGGQSRTVSNVNKKSSNVSAPQRTVQNGTHLQPPLHASDVPVAGIAAKPAESSSTRKSNRAVPKAPLSQSATTSSDTAAPTTPAKHPGDAPMQFPFQFGSISPGFMNGVQARHESFRSGPMFPIPSVPKQQLPRKDANIVEQSNTVVAHPTPKSKDAQVSSAPTLTQTLNPNVVPMGGMSMQMPFHQPPVPVQCGAPNPQFQYQGMAATTLQMPLRMPLPMGNASLVQQKVFVPNLQPHPMQHQGIMHQGQGLSFTGQMGPPIPPQLGNLGIGIAQQFPQHLAGKFAIPRRLVKITDPKTHKHVRLDQPADTYVEGGSTGPKPHTNVPQSQPIPSYTPSHPMKYYPNTYTFNTHFFTSPSSVPLTSTQGTPSSQAARFNYSVSQGPQPTSFVNPSPHNSLSSNKTDASAELPILERSCSLMQFNSPAVGKGDSPKLLRATGEAGSFLSDSTLKNEGECVANIGSGLVSLPVLDSKDKPALEPNWARNAVSRTKKKKRKEMLQRANAAGTTSDLYMAYKGPDEKIDAATQKDVASERGLLSKVVPDDWEDAADILTPKLETLCSEEISTKKYSRDFLWKLAEQCTDLPEGFEITSDVETLLGGTANISHHIDRDSHPSPGRNVNRPTAASRLDRRGSVADDDKWSMVPGYGGGSVVDDDKWSMVPGYGSGSEADDDKWSLVPGYGGGSVADDDKWSMVPGYGGGREADGDKWSMVPGYGGGSVADDDKWSMIPGYGGHVVGLRRWKGGNFGALRNPRAPVQYAGGILSGPMQSMGSQGGMQRNSPDADRWQRATGSQKGLLPSPHTP